MDNLFFNFLKVAAKIKNKAFKAPYIAMHRQDFNLQGDNFQMFILAERPKIVPAVYSEMGSCLITSMKLIIGA